MKLYFDGDFWAKANFLSKACFVLGGFFMDLGMKLSGMREYYKSEVEENAEKD